MIHHNEDGSIAYGATARYAIALIVPFWDGSRGRAKTRREMRIFTRFPRWGGDPVRGGWYTKWAYRRYVNS